MKIAVSCLMVCGQPETLRKCRIIPAHLNNWNRRPRCSRVASRAEAINSNLPRRSGVAFALVAFATALATFAAGFLVNDIGHFTGFILGAAAAVVAGCIFLYKAFS